MLKSISSTDMSSSKYKRGPFKFVHGTDAAFYQYNTCTSWDVHNGF